MVLMLASSYTSLPQNPHGLSSLSQGIPARKFGKEWKRGCIRRPDTLPSLHGDDARLRVFVLSDLHTDYSENMKWVECLSTVRHKRDALLVAGDVAETYNNFVLTMSLLKERFEHVFYVPGNHDLWCRRESDSYLGSLEKLEKLLDACKRLGVKTDPMALGSLGIIPLFSWYHQSFDREEDITSFRIPPLEMACKDYHACKWPEELSNKDNSLASYFDSMNEDNMHVMEDVKKTCEQIITFSHFVPRPALAGNPSPFCIVHRGPIAENYRNKSNDFEKKDQAANLTAVQELCPEKRMLFYPNLPKIIGSDCLEVRLRSIHRAEGSGSACHVFGHTHFCWDAMLDGIRYVQAPLAYPRERKRRMNGGEDWLPFCIYSDSKFAERLSPCYWSDYYSVNPRQPHDTKLAPWVARFYSQRIDAT